MRKDNNPNYRTGKIIHFKDFVQNIDSESSELSKIDRQQMKDHDSEYELPNEFRQKWNRVTNKYDIDSKSHIRSKLKDSKNLSRSVPKHKFKLSNDEINPNHFFKSNRDVLESKKGEGLVSYMFFDNLETIHSISKKILSLNKEDVNNLLNDGHNWAEDHVSVAKELITHVYNFLEDDELTESKKSFNYMFFANLENISKYCEEMLEMNPKTIDEILNQGHDWAEDHISSAKENILQVWEWLRSSNFLG